MSLEDRVAALEAEVLRLREQLTDTHMLAAHADRDVAEFRDELRVQTGLINLTRQDMNELRGEMTGLNSRVEDLGSETRAGFRLIAGMLEQLGAQRPEEL